MNHPNLAKSRVGTYVILVQIDIKPKLVETESLRFNNVDSFGTIYVMQHWKFVNSALLKRSQITSLTFKHMTFFLFLIPNKEAENI